MDTILFDLDGTLTDPKVGITSAVAYALKQTGIEVIDLEELCVFIGPPLKTSFMKLYGFDEATATQAVKDYRVYFERQGMLENEVYEGIEEMLQALCDAGKTLLVATSKPTVYAKQILDHFKLSKYFLDICGSELDGTRSLKQEVITYAIQTNHLMKEDCMMIGDRKHDMIGAKQNQIKTIGVLFGYGTKEELVDAQADKVVETVAELKQALLDSRI